MFQFFKAGGHFCAGAAVHNVYAFRAHAQGGTGRVHGHVARAKHGNVLAGVGRGVLCGKVVSAAKVDAGEVFVGRKHAHEVLAGYAQKDGQASAHADEHGVVFLAQVGNINGAATHGIEVEVHPCLTQAVDFGSNHILGQTEGGDAVNEHAAGFVQGFKYVYLDARSGAHASTGQGRGARADAGHFFGPKGQGTGIGTGNLLTGGGGNVGIGHKAFKTANGHGLSLGLEHALAFALVFLRAYAATNGGQAVGGLDDAVGRIHIALGDLMDKVADGYFDRAAGNAQGLFALKAAAGLCLGHFLGVAKRNFFKVGAAHLGGLTGHIHAGSHGLFGLAILHG